MTSVAEKIAEKIERLSPLLIWAAVLMTLLLVPLAITGLGYLPGDDALRHAAKAVSGRPWSEIVVQRPGVGIDHHAAWHSFLARIHASTDCGADGLVVFAVVVLFLLVFLAPLWAFRRPEAWLALWVGAMVSGFHIERFLFGRPYLVSVAAMLAILSIWTRFKPATKKSLAAVVFASTLLMFLAAWIHGSWYLLAIIPAGFFFAKQWRACWWLSLSWGLGSLLAGLASGSPFAFLYGQVFHMLHAMGDSKFVWLKVSEFQPSGGGGLPAVVWLAFSGIQIACAADRKRAARETLESPLFMIAALGWLLGLKVTRFWIDWGMPCALLWMALQLEKLLIAWHPSNSTRLAACLAVCLAFAFQATADNGGRWTQGLRREFIDVEGEGMAGWMPDDGGVIYSTSMGVFYNTFFKYPHAKWKYLLSFEPAMMPPDDHKTYNHIRWNAGDPRAFKPWLDKMRPQDRLIIEGASGSEPKIPELEWHYGATGLWIGRLPLRTGLREASSAKVGRRRPG